MIELDESRRSAFDQSIKNQKRIKGVFDKKTRNREFQQNDMVLLWNKKKEKAGQHGKFESLWTGPFIIRETAGLNSFYLSHLDGTEVPLPANGLHLKLFFTENI